MKIAKIKIENFRSFKDETIIFDNYICLVGPNGSGKSTVLTALNIFFRETADATTDLLSLSKEDFHNCNTSEPIKITITFNDLNDEAKTQLKDYVRQDLLVVSAVAVWDERSQKADVAQYGERLGIKTFAEYFAKEKAGVGATELKEFYQTLREKFTDLPGATTKPKMEEALHEYEEHHSELCELIPSSDQFYGVSRGVNRIEQFLQWVYIPAVKDATKEQVEGKNTAVGKLLTRRVRTQLKIDVPLNELRKEILSKYKILLNGNSTALDTLSESLTSKFRLWAHEHASLKLNWQEGDKAVSIATPIAEVKAVEGLFQGDIARFGHGLQRSFIFTLLEELSEHTDSGPCLILGCEEPELYQHPPQARHLATVLQKLSVNNSQILLCTHSPYFISGRNFENVRITLKNNKTGAVSVKQTTFDAISEIIADATGDKPIKAGGTAAKIEQEMETPMNEMFFATFCVFVEGQEDIAYLSSYMSLLNKWDEFRSLGGHFIQVQGKAHLLQALAISNKLMLPSFVIFDCDGDTPADTPEKRTGRRDKHQKENTAILKLMSIENINAFPDESIFQQNLITWPKNISDIFNSELGKENVEPIKNEVRTKYGINCPDMDKNPLFIGYIVAHAWDKGLKPNSIIKACESILDFGRKLN